MAKAICNGAVLAEGDKYEMAEGNVYFPPESVSYEYPDDRRTDYECLGKGHVDYYDIIIVYRANSDTAWSYPDPKLAAKQIKEHVAFERRKRVQIQR